MNRMLTKRISTTALVCVALGAAACSKQKSEAAQRAEATSGAITHQDSMAARVESVDRDQRTLTLRTEQGDPMTVSVGERVDLERVQAGDELQLDYKESLALEIQKPGTEPKLETSTTAEQLPEGVEIGRQVKATVEIIDVAPGGAAVTFRGPKGEVQTVNVEDPKSQTKVAALRAGDDVEVTYVESLALQIEPDRQLQQPQQMPGQQQQMPQQMPEQQQQQMPHQHPHEHQHPMPEQQQQMPQQMPEQQQQMPQQMPEQQQQMPQQ